MAKRGSGMAKAALLMLFALAVSGCMASSYVDRRESEQARSAASTPAIREVLRASRGERGDLFLCLAIGAADGGTDPETYLLGIPLREYREDGFPSEAGGGATRYAPRLPPVSGLCQIDDPEKSVPVVTIDRDDLDSLEATGRRRMEDGSGPVIYDVSGAGRHRVFYWHDRAIFAGGHFVEIVPQAPAKSTGKDAGRRLAAIVVDIVTFPFQLFLHSEKVKAMRKENSTPRQ